MNRIYYIMFWFGAKKKVIEEFKKVSESFLERDDKISQNKEDINSNKERIARLEGAISVLLKSQSPKVSINPKQSHSKIETKIINRVRRSKKSIVIAEISKLMPSLSVIDIFDIVVKEKGLCSKASFYRYVASLKSQSQIKMRQK